MAAFPTHPLLTLDLPTAHEPTRRDRNAARVGERARQVITRLADLTPEPLRAAQLADMDRLVFHVEQSYLPGGAIADLGGGLGLFAPACAALGMDSFLVDDFGDAVNVEHPIHDMPPHRTTGVQIVKTDVNHWGEYFADESLDVVTSFDSIEHWHCSPRRALLEAHRVLRPGGVLLLGTPNAVNLRKRIAVVLGRSNWSQFEDWYYPDRFRGHVREPVLGDLLRMVDDLGFECRKVWGRNWSGYAGGRTRRMVTRMIDLPLRARPTLCSDLYVMAVKPA
jgi:SAM-dependent methyltransferase